MEKQTRINKYRELREEMKEEVGIERQVLSSQDDEEDDFLSFLPKDEQKNVDDTLMEPLSYEMLDHDNEEVRNALNEAKVKIGKNQYNTRLDILNKIKKEDQVSSHETSIEPGTRSSQNRPEEKMSLLEKLAAMSPEEDVKELEKYEQDLTVSELMKEKKKKKKVKKEKTVSQPEEVYEQNEQEEYFEEDDEQEDGKLVTVLNYVIIVFIIIFIVFAFLIVKQLF